MTPEQCHPVYYNSQQAEGSTGREALDGTDTQVATCTSNNWTARMKGAEEYITKEVSRRGGIAIRKTPEGPSYVVSEDENKNSSSDEARG